MKSPQQQQSSAKAQKVLQNTDNKENLSGSQTNQRRLGNVVSPTRLNESSIMKQVTSPDSAKEFSQYTLSTNQHFRSLDGEDNASMVQISSVVKNLKHITNKENSSSSKAQRVKQNQKLSSFMPQRISRSFSTLRAPDAEEQYSYQKETPGRDWINKSDIQRAAKDYGQPHPKFGQSALQNGARPSHFQQQNKSRKPKFGTIQINMSQSPSPLPDGRKGQTQPAGRLQQQAGTQSSGRLTPRSAHQSPSGIRQVFYPQKDARSRSNLGVQSQNPTHDPAQTATEQRQPPRTPNQKVMTQRENEHSIYANDHQMTFGTPPQNKSGQKLPNFEFSCEISEERKNKTRIFFQFNSK